MMPPRRAEREKKDCYIHQRDAVQGPQLPDEPIGRRPSSSACSILASWASDSLGAGPLGPLLRRASVPAGLPAGMPDAHRLGRDLELAGDLSLVHAGGEQLGRAQSSL
jgi:hypothetical protein